MSFKNKEFLYVANKTYRVWSLPFVNPVIIDCQSYSAKTQEEDSSSPDGLIGVTAILRVDVCWRPASFDVLIADTPE